MVKNWKRIIGFLFSVVFCTVIAVGMPQVARAAEVAIDATNFPDANFRSYVSSQFDKDSSHGLSEEEIANIWNISVCYKNITSLKGIEHFIDLTYLNCSYNQLTAIDVSHNIALRELDCFSNPLTANLDLSHNIALTKLSCSSNQLTSLDLSKNTALTSLDCSFNLTSLDLSHNTALTSLTCCFNQLTSLDLSHNTALTSLYCAFNPKLVSLDLSHNTALTSLICYSNKQLTNLDLSHNTALKGLSCYSNQLTSLDISNNTKLTSLNCGLNQLTSLNVSTNTALTSLECYSNKLTSLDVSTNTKLTNLNCSNNKLTSLNVSKNTALTELSCYSNQLTSLDVRNNTALTSLSCYSNQLTSLDVRNNTALTRLYCYSNQLTSLGVNGATALTELSCYSNQLTSLDVRNNTALTRLYCYSNKLTSLGVNGATALKTLSCYSNQLTSLDVSNNTKLTSLDCSNNQLTELKLNSQTYSKLSLYKKYLHGDVSLSDLQNITETATNNSNTVSLLKVTDITKLATYKVNGKDFTIIYADKVIISSESPSPEPSVSPSTSPTQAPVPSLAPSPDVPSNNHIFSDYDYTSPVTSGSAIIYGNGINKKIDGKKVNNKALTLYTDILASYKHEPNSNGTVKSSVGKVIVAVTKTADKPAVDYKKNKVTDTSASKIAKAKIKNGQITVTTVGKESGLVYLWVIDTGTKGISACCPIDVKLAPKKLEVQSTTGTKLANPKIQNGTTLDVHVTGLVGSAKTEDCTYTATVDSKYQSYVQIAPKGTTGQDFTITAKGLKGDKDTKAAIIFTCDQNGKKVKFSLTITK